MARTLSTEHGELRLPAFLPDATKGAVRAVDSQDLARCGVEGVVVNVYHLSARPGCRTVKAAGGIHRFMAWDRPVLSDSGGFQIYSLLAERQVLGSVSKRGFRYRKGPQGRRRILTPEKSVCLQFDLGSDIVLCLDHCTHPGAPKDEQRASVENTVAWARAGRSEFDRLCDRTGRRPFIFSAVQGGDDPALRRECAERLLEIGFDGWAYGGWPVTEDGRLLDAVATVAELLPKGVPLWGLGLGKPEHVARCIALGYTLFDCVIPTRDARHGRLFVFLGGGRDPAYECLYPQDRKYARDPGPVEASCDCLCCTSYSRAYLHHLFGVRDVLALRLATLHNLRFYTRLLDRLRP